ncbi:MAG TPA: polysaccharide deacetylase family protein [Dehalococcoidia bacterium]|nr:polysaccharide deacetylase family protein [Dehalococcoidia bacterium]
MDRTSTDPISIKRVFLTFDDGPCHPYTSQVLDTLKTAGARATFFVCGRNVQLHPELAGRIVNEGHAIGNHTYSHSKARAFLGWWGNQVDRTTDIIREATGVETKLFRPPWGLLPPWLNHVMKAKGYRTFRWDIKANDWETPGAEVICRRVVERVKPGSVVLLHDGEKSLADTNRSQTVLALSGIISILSQQGYQFDRL